MKIKKAHYPLTLRPHRPNREWSHWNPWQEGKSQLGDCSTYTHITAQTLLSTVFLLSRTKISGNKLAGNLFFSFWESFISLRILLTSLDCSPCQKQWKKGEACSLYRSAYINNNFILDQSAKPAWVSQQLLYIFIAFLSTNCCESQRQCIRKPSGH